MPRGNQGPQDCSKDSNSGIASPLTITTQEKTVYSMHSKVVDSHRFKLYLCTQAGTYIKEFVHSDFGQTQPSLGGLLSGRDVNILSLDVTDVQLDWPPSRKREESTGSSS